MKNIFLTHVLIMSMLMFTACGKGSNGNGGTTALACTGDASVATWTSQGGSDQLTISPNCVVTSSYCQSSNTITPGVKIGSTNFTLSVVQSNSAATCPSVGSHSCSVAFSGDGSVMGINCGNGLIYYTKQ